MGDLGYILISTGLVFFLGTTIGLLRFPDFYTRMHAAGKGDTLSTVMILIGCICLSSTKVDGMELLLLALKILLIINFIFIGSPTATHAMMDAGNKAGAVPWRKDSE